MTKTKFYFARAFFALLTVAIIASLAVMLTSGVSAQSTETVIYLSDEGNDTNDGKGLFSPVRTLSKACALAGKDGKIVITDTYTHKADNALTCASRAASTGEQLITRLESRPTTDSAIAAATISMLFVSSFPARDWKNLSMLIRSSPPTVFSVVSMPHIIARIGVRNAVKCSSYF